MPVANEIKNEAENNIVLQFRSTVKRSLHFKHNQLRTWPFSAGEPFMTKTYIFPLYIYHSLEIGNYLVVIFFKFVLKLSSHNKLTS